MEQDNSYYGNGSDTPDEAGAQSPDSTQNSSEPTDNAQTALLPKEFFGDKELNVGDECKIKIVHIYEDEVEVEYEMDDKPDSEESTPSNAMSQIESMAQPAQEGS